MGLSGFADGRVRARPGPRRARPGWSRVGENVRVSAENPTRPPTVPAPVASYAAGRDVRHVWSNVSDGLTFQIGDGARREFFKWSPHSAGIDLAAETARLRWAAPYLAVPRVLSEGRDETAAWFVSAGLPGASAVDERWLREPATAVAAIGRSLRALHELLPVERCPFDRSAHVRLERVRARAAAGAIEPGPWRKGHQDIATVERALELLAEIPPVTEFVVCHGDACAPNTLIGDDGDWCGLVDLGLLGVADRWADLALATWSARRNFGPDWEEPLLEAYGVAPDPERTAYYRLLADLGD
jgi:kanamycin kinase